MEKNKVVIKGSFRGISADLIKNLLILALTWVVYLLCRTYMNNLYAKNGDEQFFKYLLAMDNVSLVITLAGMYLIIVITAIIAISTLIKTIGVLYHLADETTFDFTINRVITRTFSFPLNKTTDENKLNEIININVEQGTFHRLFNAGNMYIEFISNNTVDSQLRNIELHCIALPFMQKNKIM